MKKSSRTFDSNEKSDKIGIDDTYRKIADDTPVIIWTTYPDGACTYLNKKWYEYTGQTNQEGLQFGWLSMVHPDDLNQARDIFLEANKHQKAFSLEYRLKDKEGNYRWHLDAGNPRWDEHGKYLGFIGTVIDIHERTLMEDSLRASEEYFKKYAEVMPQMAFIADVDGNIVYFNKRWYDYVDGIENTEGWGWRDKPIHHPDDLERTIARWNHSLRTGEPYEIEYRLRRHDGQYRWHLGRALPMLNVQGTIEFWFGTNTDIQKIKETEEALTESKAALHQERELLTKNNQLHKNLLYLLAHDLKNPLNNVKMIASLIKDEKDPKEIPSLIKSLENAIIRQEDILNGLVEIMQVQAGQSEAVESLRLTDMIQIVLEETKMDMEEAAGNITFNCREANQLYYVKQYLHSLLKNLVTNAIKYRKPDDPLRIEITSTKGDGFVVVSISDNGIGIDLNKYKNQLFQPFKRFTDRAPGTGIGLYIIRNIVEYNGGYIEVESEPGKGTTFHCFLKEYVINP